MFQVQMTSSEVKKYLGGFSSPLLFGLILAAFAVAFWYGVAGWKELKTLPDSQRQMSFSGEGKVSARPDIAVFSATVITQAKKVKDAQSGNSERSNAIFGFLKGAGVEEKDLKTANYTISPEYQYFRTPPCPLVEGDISLPCPVSKPPVIVSYQVRHIIEVKIRDLEKVDDLLDGVISNGANEVGQVYFQIEDEEKLKAEARKMAIDNAREKAKVLARDLGVRLGKIVSFSESGGPISIYARTLDAKGGFGGDFVEAPEIQPGEQEIRANVTITYEFR